MPRSLKLAVVLFALTLVAAQPPTDSWTGQKVLARNPGRTLEGKLGQQKVTLPVHHLVYTCTSDLKTDIEVNYPGQLGYDAKAEWVRLPDALEYFTGRTKADPKDAFAWSRRGVAHRYAGKLDLALADLQEAVKLDPKNADFVGIRGMMWWANKDLDKAIADYTTAVTLDPTYAVGFRNRAMALRAKGELDRAIADYTESARVGPRYAPAYHERGTTWLLKKEYGRAFADLEKAYQLDNRFIPAMTDLARLQATCPEEKFRNAKTAVRLAQIAMTGTHQQDAAVLDVAAMAYAEAGDFARAIMLETRALKDAAFEKEHGEKARERLKLFEAKKPWRE